MHIKLARMSSQKKSILNTVWIGMNQFFQSITKFFNKSFNKIIDFAQSSPILFSILNIFLFFIEGVMFFFRGMIIESTFNKIVNSSSKAYKFLKLDRLSLEIKKMRYNFCSKETKLKIQCEILTEKIIHDFIEKNIYKDNEQFIFKEIIHSEKTNNSEQENSTITTKEEKTLKAIILDSINGVFNLVENKNFEKNNQIKFTKIKNNLSNDFKEIKFNKDFYKDDEKVSHGDEEILKHAIYNKIFHSKIRNSLSNLILSEFKSRINANNINTNIALESIIENLSKKTNFQKKI